MQQVLAVGDETISLKSYPFTLKKQIGRTMGSSEHPNFKAEAYESRSLAIAFIEKTAWLCISADEGVLNKHISLPCNWLETEAISLTKVMSL